MLGGVPVTTSLSGDGLRGEYGRLKKMHAGTAFARCWDSVRLRKMQASKQQLTERVSSVRLQN